MTVWLCNLIDCIINVFQSKSSDYVLTIDFLALIINSSLVKQTQEISSTQRFVVKLSSPYLSPQLCEPSCIWPPHSPILMRARRQNRMSGCVLQRITAICLCFCMCTVNEAVCLNTIPFNVLTTNRPSAGKKPGDAFFFFSSSFVTCLQRANNQDQIFNFTSYLCSTDGCKLILWQRAATVPNRGSILSESARWHQEQLRGGQRKVTTKMRLDVQKQESPGPGVSRSRLIHKSLQRKK